MAFGGERSQPWKRTISSVRAAGLVCLTALTAAWMSYMAQAVPVPIQRLPEQFAPRMRVTAITALLVMLAVDALILIAVFRQQRRDRIGPPGKTPLPRGIPAALLPRAVGLRTLGATALASSTVVFGSALVGLPPWAIGFMALLPWLPLYVFEASWQYRHYGALVLFGTLVLLQLGHLAEHVVQNFQLVLTHGKLAASRGVFGQLDVEAVHFYWNIGIWLGTGALLYRYGLRNVWLTVAFVAASLHSVEHMYLYWLYATHSSAYLVGGWNGILGQGGLVGTPLVRPYLHLVYNVIEVTPFVLAYYDQSRLMYDRNVAHAPAESVRFAAQQR